MKYCLSPEYVKPHSDEFISFPVLNPETGIILSADVSFASFLAPRKEEVSNQLNDQKVSVLYYFLL